MPLSQLQLQPASNGTLLPVQARPKSRRNAVSGIHDGRLKIAVTAAPEKGKANTAIIRLLAGQLGVAPSSITVRSGATSSRKVLLVQGTSPDELLSQLAGILNDN